MGSGGGDLFGGYGASCFEHNASEGSLWSTNWVGRSTLTAHLTRAFSEVSGSGDGEDYITGLVEEIAQASVVKESKGIAKRRDCWSSRKQESNTTAQTLSTSPQSTLAGMSWDLLSPGSSCNGGLSSGFSSPPTPVEAAVAASMPSHAEKDTLDLLYAELLRLKMEDDLQARQQQLIQLKQQQQYQNLLWKIRQQHAATAEEHKLGTAYRVQSVLPPNISSNGYYCRSGGRRTEDVNQYSGCKTVNAAWSAPRVQRSGQSGGIRQGSWGAGDSTNNADKYRGFYSRPKPQGVGMNGGMRAVFLGTPGSRESSGTGVFLPRRLGSGSCGGGGSSSDSRRKPACSTVLLPSRVVQALNLTVEDTIPHPAFSSVSRRGVSAAPAQCSSSIASNRTESMSSEWNPAPKSVPVSCSPLLEVAPDISLPTEWTY